ncbi:hypothetical protein J416_05548 [Gracilibacillus halophilus YIM-C55.5]|uniref:Uncharacterized protein n=1 Tax=Gracilibacillus halophilus YIM-C55.5 TaxID=1308866 RepID=N4WMS1_9BACI|nr:YqhG family protein [Gracilibacillus halophilus]ENH97452.1 hypothetical protein J416_05548 [Gracilibacillus halophilus YIM-C55.5]
MEITNLFHFLKDFFEHQECHVSISDQHALSVQLTRELDEALMNRPFYWHYMDKIGRKGDPMTLEFYVATSL